MAGDTICALETGPGGAGSLWAWRASDGKVLWKSDADGGFTSVAITGRIICAISVNSELLALDARHGTKIWAVPANANTSLAISGNLVYAGTPGGGVIALSLSNGKPVWRSPTYFTAGPVVEGNAAYVSDTNKVYALRA
jgi:outer membrane protein assembly factor BamB